MTHILLEFEMVGYFSRVLFKTNDLIHNPNVNSVSLAAKCFVSADICFIIGPEKA